MPEAATIEVAKDMTYAGPMTYRAVPVASLLAGLTLPPDSVIEAVAIDGFAAQLPLDLLLNTDASKAIAWVAIEPTDRPWPKISGKEQSAGPFYIVWTGPEAASIRSEYWAYQAAKLVSQLSPVARWPACDRRPTGDRSDPRRPDSVRRPVPALPQVERSRLVRRRARS